jgi:ABC-type uncharacterized transport system fused permease/ATPase subunit
MPVLHGLSFGVSAGTVTGMLGPSGCGKTTLMRAIVGVQAVEGGRVEVLGEPAGSPPLRSRVGYVTQAPSVYRDLSVRENLRYFARVLGAPHERIERTIATVALGGQADQSSPASPAGRAPEPRSPRRCSASPTCWSSTSRRSASTRCCAATSGRPFASWPRPARPCSSPAT